MASRAYYFGSRYVGALCIGVDSVRALQDDNFTDSYISTIGVDFVSVTALWLVLFRRCCLLQRFRTITIDKKVVKLQIVRRKPEKQQALIAHFVCSGTQQAKNGSAPSQALITAELMVALLQ